MRGFCLALLAAAALASRPALGGAGLDLHRLWDDRCLECHGHSADFARAFLVADEGRLRGSHGAGTMRRFLGNHYVVESEVDAVYAMLLAQAATPPRFRDECSACHRTASQFVRASLEPRDGELFGRRSRRPVRDFMLGHRGLDEADVSFYSRLLERVAGEVYR